MATFEKVTILLEVHPFLTSMIMGGKCMYKHLQKSTEAENLPIFVFKSQTFAPGSGTFQPP